MRGGGAGGDKEKEKNWDDDLNHVSSGGGGMWVDGRRVGNEEAGEEKTGDTVKHYDADGKCYYLPPSIVHVLSRSMWILILFFF